MNLDRVTVTGADDRTAPEDLARLSERFSFVEWGILVSKSSEGRPRFPTQQWIRLLGAVMPVHVPLSLHVCGRWVRQLMLGEDDLLEEAVIPFDRFLRLQLNFHAQHHDVQLGSAFRMFDLALAGRQFIFQMDGTGNEGLLHSFRAEGFDAVPLFDLSGGAGVLPAEWPAHMGGYCGYAGGLSPENVEAQIQRIAAAAGHGRIWIDVETRVRSDDDQILDLAKVERFLEVAAPHVTVRL